MLLLAQLSNTLQQLSSVPSSIEQCRQELMVDGHRQAGCLHAAIIAGKLSTLHCLLADGCDPNETYNNQTPLNLCMSFHNSPKNIDPIKLLIKHGANVNLHNPLHVACQRGLLTVIG